jgi:16S rRNA C967 or C1407 C5-methylase (RsmB/RsmF family)/NOL1/NOP2/fmu family ribosome biogenesis protein
MPLPPAFEQQMRAQLGPQWPDFEAALREQPPVSIRYNLSKTTLPSEAIGDAVPWHPHARYLAERPVFTLDPAFHAGAYYVQEASSMFLYEALRQTVDFSKSLKILDLCAAPGGKSTLLAEMLDPTPTGRGVSRLSGARSAAAPLPVGESLSRPVGRSGVGLLVANETIRARVAPLRENLERWGSPNVAVVSAEAEELAALEGWFDVVVADAPCSGEGLFRKDPDAVGEWSPAHVEFCAARQKRILAAAVQALTPGGILAFSTCTYNAQENDSNLAWLSQSFDLELIKLEIPDAWGIERTVAGGYQCYPHRLRGEGFFLAIFRKKAGAAPKHALPTTFKNLKPLPKNLVSQAAAWLAPQADAHFFQTPSGEVLALPAALEGAYLLMDKHLKAKWFGTAVGEFKGKDFVPSHALALSQWVSPDLPAVDLSRAQALLFLKKETFEPPLGAPLGWALARHEGLNLGWLKILPNRLNNYLPQERRIRMSL